jgi:hypothetical protein
MAKKRSFKYQKRKTWEAFSFYIRTRDCLITTGGTDAGVCVTCGKIFQFNELQAGHFIPGRRSGILFDERCVHAQCQRCNGFKGGNIAEYRSFMIRNYDKKIIDELWENARKTIQFKQFELKRMETYYQETAKALAEGRQPIPFNTRQKYYYISH